MGDRSAEQWQRADEDFQKKLPQGVKLVRTLQGHEGIIGRIAWSPDGRMLASPSEDKTIRLWDAKTGECLRLLSGHTDQVKAVSFDRQSRVLASGGFDKTIKLWEVQSGRLLRALEGHIDWVNSVSFDFQGSLLASGCEDGWINLWDADSGRIVRTFKAHQYGINSVAFDPLTRVLASGGFDGAINLWRTIDGKLLCTLKEHPKTIWSIALDLNNQVLASAGGDRTIDLWEVVNGSCRLLRTLEGHTSSVHSVAFLFNGELIASKANDSTIRLWSKQTGMCVAQIPETSSGRSSPSLAFHPYLPLLATVGSVPGTPEKECDRIIHIWELDIAALLGQCAIPSITYSSAKVVLVGDSGVGKTGLGWRLANGEFRESFSTHGMQFWLLKQLCKQRFDGTQCEAVLWDLAGQPDYRLTHALFLNDVDLALILFDSTHSVDPLSGIEFWLKQLKTGTGVPSGIPTILVAARSDRGTPSITQEELQAYCHQHGIASCILTSAKTGEGIEELIRQMHGMIPWEAKPATITTETFKRIKDFVLNLKEDSRRLEVILRQEELRQRLEKTDRTWKFSDDEMLTAIGHLANHGYVTRLKTSQGELRILLIPELLRNLAASFVLESRRNPKGLGSLEEQLLLSGGYKFFELERLSEEEKDILLDSTVVLFLEHNICYRETDPLNDKAYLVFPELINLKKPLITDGIPTEESVAYTASGAVENVYASLVVLMGYTHTFTRTNQWRDHARYEVGKGLVCGFRQENERDGELDFVLYFGMNTPAYVRTLFQGLFESFLARHNLTVLRYEPVKCPKGHTLNRAIVMQKVSSGAGFTFCNDCGRKIILPKADKPIQLTKGLAVEVEADRRAADRRSRFEQVLFRLKNYVTDQKILVPECFISYAWGNPEQERWVEKSLATDLQKAGISVVLDRWENARIGASVPRFVECVGKTKRVIVIGTPLYRKKYDNKEPMRSFIVAAEGDLIGTRMIGTEADKESVLPVLLEGTKESAFPLLLQSRVYADFRKKEAYIDTAFELLLSLYQIPPQDPVAIELRESLMSHEERGLLWKSSKS